VAPTTDEVAPATSGATVAPTAGNPRADLRSAAAPLLAEYERVSAEMADPAVQTDSRRARRLGARFSELGRVREVVDDLAAVDGDLAAAVELGDADAGFFAEADTLRSRQQVLAERLRRLLVPRDPDDSRDVILEVHAGEGGTESALFAADLLRMYTRYAERVGWRTRLLETTGVELGGVKSAALSVAAPPGSTDPAAAPWARLKFEGGVHRVQRVPVTESAGRIHTSAAGVLVLPEADEVEVTIDPKDLRIDVFRSSGPGGQSVNTTDSAVRITHLPTGTVVSCQNEKSQLQNREQALRILRARLLADAREEAAAAASDARRGQVRTVDRSERIRTYNFPENRITDHRIGYKAYNLDAVLAGDLTALLDASVAADESARLVAATDST